jgi:hypothetical protein
MTNERIKRMLTLLAMLAASAVFAVGCGDDDDDGGDSGGGVGATTEQTETGSGGGSTEAPKNTDEAVDRCLEEAGKLDGQAKETAEASCRAIESGNTDEVQEEAKKQCLEATEQIPDEAARKQAEESCELLDK